MKTALIAVAGLILAAASPAAAEEIDRRYSPEWKRCIGASGGNTFDIIDCNETELGAWDKKLNAEYKAVMASLPAAKQQELRSVQRDWIKRRDAKCGAMANPDEGQAGRMAASGCVLEMTARRAVELERMPR